jgi:hypothetical protein
VRDDTPYPAGPSWEMTDAAATLSSHCTLLDWPKPVSSGLSAIFHRGGYLRPKGHFPTLCNKGIAGTRKKINNQKKPGITTYVPGMGDNLNMQTASASACNQFCTNFSRPIASLAKDNALMNSANPSSGTSFHKASPMLKHVLGRALESQRTKGDCREAMKTIFND